MGKLWYLWVPFLIFSLGADGTTPVTAPATNAREKESWTIPIPSQNLTVTLEYPKDWKKKGPGPGAPVVFKEDAASGGMEVIWTFDIKNGAKGRTIEQIRDQFAAILEKQPNCKLVEKNSLEPKDGKARMFVTYLLTKDRLQVVVRDCFYKLDEDRVMITSETVPSLQSDKYAKALQSITDSVKVETVAPAK